MVDPIVTPAIIESTLNAVSTLITQLFQHLDKPATELRLLDMRKAKQKLLELDTQLSQLIDKIEVEE